MRRSTGQMTTPTPAVLAPATPLRAQRLVGIVPEAVLRRLDAAVDAGATIVALATMADLDIRGVLVVLAVHLAVAMGQNHPVPFLLEQLFGPARVAAASALAGGVAVATSEVSAGAALGAAGLTAMLCAAGRVLLVAALRWARRHGLVFERAVVVGNSLERLALRQACAHHREYGIEVTGEIDTAELHRLTRSAGDESGATALVIARGVPLSHEVVGELRWAVTRGYRVLVETGPGDTVPAGEVFHLANARVVCLPHAPLTYRSWLVKRAFDLVVSFLLLLVLLPVLAVAALGVRLSSPGPILFRQPRIGRDGRVFTMLKFRTFPVDHVDDTFSLDHRECPLPFGRFLRRTSIDELPQLFNVLRGEMSIVGPRPERPHFAGLLAPVVPGYHERHRVPGGITGLAQVNGLWGNSDIAERIRHDNAYIDSWRLRRDFAILMRTVPATVRKGRSRQLPGSPGPD